MTLPPIGRWFSPAALRPRTAAWLLQGVLWVLLTVFYFAWYNRPNYHFDGPIWTLVLLRLLYGVLLFNALVYLIIPRWLLRGHFGRAGLGLVGLVLLFGVWNYYGYWLADHLVTLPPVLARLYRGTYEVGLRAAVFSANGLLSTFFEWQYAMLIPLVISFVAYAQLIDRRRLALERDQLRLELRYLKAQVNPQFLFHTLGNLHQLTTAHDARAGDVVLHLADLMRYTLYESDTATVPLARELEFLADYLALERLRSRPEISIEHETTGAATAQRVVPLLLFPFVERLFAELPAGPVRIESRLTVAPDAFTLTLTRTTAAAPPFTYRTDAAVAAALRRLQLEYPGRHTAQVQEAAQRVAVVIQLAL